MSPEGAVGIRLAYSTEPWVDGIMATSSRGGGGPMAGRPWDVA